MTKHINVIGAGLAGCEAAWQIAKRGIEVHLYEMKPHKKSPAHHSDTFAELVCSNSFRSDMLENAVGLLKEELRLLDSLIIQCADENRVPAGGALAVDRHGFSQEVTNKILANPNIKVYNEEVTWLSDDAIIIVATGPLTSEPLAEHIWSLMGEDSLYFFDAAAPIVRLDSINMDIAFKASRYNKGDADYINCPMTKDQYLPFYEELINAQTASLKEFENIKVFEGCMPIETMAKRGIDTMRFGPLKPVGLNNPTTGEEYYAVVQLRQDDAAATLYNLVGFQTNLKWGEQKRVFSMIPGLENAEFERFGVMHRNTFLNSPKLLDGAYRLKKKPNIFFAGQITGVEGYVESISSGLMAGINSSRQFNQLDHVFFPGNTVIGALARYISNPSVSKFQPMNANFGIVDSLPMRIRNKKERYSAIAQNALDEIAKIEL